MAIKIPNWIKNTAKYFATAFGAGAATALVVVMAITPDQYARQIVVGQDTTMVIVNGDTTRHETTESDLTRKYRAAEQYDNGYRLHVWEYKTINVLTGEVTPEVLLTIAPPVGMQVNWKARAGSAELATNKIPEKLDALGDSLSNAIGYYKVMDTVDVDSVKTFELQRRWADDKDAKPVRIEYVAPVIGEISEIIEVK